MTLEFFTYLLALSYMLHKADIIDKKQMLKVIEVANQNSSKSIEEFITEMWDVVAENEKKPENKKSGKKQKK